MNCYEFESGFMSQEEKEISTTAAAGSASTVSKNFQNIAIIFFKMIMQLTSVGC